MKKIIVMICLALAVSAGRAQSPFSFHAKAGIGTSRLYGKHSGSETQIAYKAGIGAEYMLNSTWALQSALEFVSIGGCKDMKYVRYAKMHELYLQIPVTAAVRLPLGENYHVSLDVGAYIACGAGGKTSGSIPYYYNNSSTKAYRHFRIDTFGCVLADNAGNRRLDAGITTGIEFEYRRFIIGAEAQVGLVKVNQQLYKVMKKEFNGYLPRNFASFFTVGYRFRFR